VRRHGPGLAILTCLLLGNCAKYQPHALNPVQSEADLRARVAPARLDAETLTAAALHYSGDLAVARAKVASAEAAMITARQRVNPSLSAEGGYNRTPDSVVTYAFAPAFTIETAGKRGFRTLAAQKSAEASRIALLETEWQVRSRVRAALVGYFFAQRRLASLLQEQQVRAEVVQIFEKRVALGEASNPELNAARVEQSALLVNLRTAEGEAAQALAALAGATGLPLSAFEGHTVEPGAYQTPPSPDSLPLTAVQKAGLLHRADIRRTLVEYEAADARLRLELANQYPNITLSPSYTFQEGFPAYTLGSVLESLPLLHRHEGPIAEAEAARREVEARFIALQAQALAETATALAQYRAAVAEWLTSRDGLEPAQQKRQAAVTASFRAGESDRLDVAQARVMSLSAGRGTIEAALRAQTALGSLEDAVQSTLTPETKH
jgi:cobalt-zinc-cadmium efflux system outer membrane protein